MQLKGTFLKKIGFKNEKNTSEKPRAQVSTKGFDVSYCVCVEWSYIIGRRCVAARGSWGKQNQQKNGFQEIAAGNCEKPFGLLIRSDRCGVMERFKRQRSHFRRNVATRCHLEH